MALPIIPRGEMMPAEAAKFHKFANPPGNGGLGESPDLIALPDTTFNMTLLVNMDLPLRDGGNIPMWIVQNPDDPVNGQTFPSPTVRIPQGASSMLMSCVRGKPIPSTGTASSRRR